MPTRHVPYRYNNYTDVLRAIGTAQLVRVLYEHRDADVHIEAAPHGFVISHPNDDLGRDAESNPFRQIKDKASRETDSEIGAIWDKTQYERSDDNPPWWTTISVINSLASPRFNNKLARQYTPELGLALLDGTADVKTGSRSQLLYAPASKGTNASSFRGTPTRQGNISADAEQMIALLGYQVGASGFIKDEYTITALPRPQSVTLRGYKHFVRGFFRNYFPRATSGKILPTRNQTVPFFLTMMYLESILRLFNYREEQQDDFSFMESPAEVIAGIDRATYFSMGTSSAPFRLDSLQIPEWIDAKEPVENVRDLVRELLSERVDPRLLNLPVRAFTESDPRPLVAFYRSYQPMQVSGNRSSKRLLEHQHLSYIMAKTKYEALDCGAMQRFAKAIRSRTLTRLYHEDQPDFDLLTKLRAASRNDDGLVSMLSKFVGDYNLRNARLSARDGKQPDGKNLRYDDLKEIIELIDDYGAPLVANTLMAQAMAKGDALKEAEHSDSADADADAKTA